jgi:ABC-type transporter Mla maintaining outer membrane lipid asymmetry permease subunit MlaE
MTTVDAVAGLDAAASVAETNALIRGVAAIGATTRRLLATVGSEARFVGDVVASSREARTWLPQVTTQALELGVQSLPIALFIATFTGAVPLYFVGTLVGKTIMLELAPVLTGLALAGRVGANIAAELGTMRVTEQIDALETLTYDPVAYLVVPRVIAGTLMFPLIVGATMVVGVGAGWIAPVLLLHFVVTGVRERPAPFFPDVRRRVRSREIGKLRLRGHHDRIHRCIDAATHSSCNCAR